MIEKEIAFYGTWKSPITAQLIASATVEIRFISVDGPDTYWTEMRPHEGGRYVIVRRSANGEIEDVNPSPFNARTRVHEYGGGHYAVAEGRVYFANYSDQRLYTIHGDGDPRPLTPEVEMRYADLNFDKGRNRLICIREDHTGEGEAVNALVTIGLNRENAGQILASGEDFYSSPRLSPDGSQIAWLSWNHPNMPWDGTDLWLAAFNEDGSLSEAKHVAGGESESIFQPEWSPDGDLFFVSDRSGWWNLYRWTIGQDELLLEMEAEFGRPQWFFGYSRYAFISAGQIACIYDQNGYSNLGLLDLNNRQLTPVDLHFSEMGSLKSEPGRLVFHAASPNEFRSVVEITLPELNLKALRAPDPLPIDVAYLSEPKAIEYATEDNLTAHAFYYPPCNPDFVAPAGTKPPVIVFIHGGPTSMTTPSLQLGKQFWTSRGFAILDVNYGGSTGFGRAYRRRLNGKWGIVDVDDCLNGVRYLVDQGLADEQKLAIRGGSAGGYTTLCALTFHNLFAVGASYFGVSDLAALAEETHKFESRYLDHIVGPYPERADIYRERSPIHHVDQLSCAMILFQGLEDKIVLPNQAEMMVEAVQAKGLPVAYLPFEGEQHGFRRSENIIRTREAELYFYGKIFGFEIADDVEPVEILNL